MEERIKPNFQKFPKKMKEFISSTGMTIEDFAKDIDVTPSTIYNANKNRKPSAYLIGKLIDKYPDIDLNWLLKDENINSLQQAMIFQEEREEYLTFLKKNVDRLKSLIDKPTKK